jgi:hypothetical protein
MPKEKSENIKSIPKKGTSIFKWVLIIIFGWAVVAGIARFNMEESFIANARVYAATESHTYAKDMVTAYFEKCSRGASTLQLKVNSTTQTTNVSCNSSMNQFSDYWAKHFNNDGWKNPYNSESTFARKANGSGSLGELRLYYSGNSLTMSTNVGDTDGGDVYLNDTIMKE